MITLHAGLACRFFTFCRRVFSEILIVSPSARNQTTDSCGRPLGLIVPSVSTCSLSRSRCDSGMLVMPRTLWRGRPVMPRGSYIVGRVRRVRVEPIGGPT